MEDEGEEGIKDVQVADWSNYWSNSGAIYWSRKSRRGQVGGRE